MATTVRTRKSRPARVRLRAAPALDPPYEDETDPVRWTFGRAAEHRAAQLTLDLPPAGTRPAFPQPASDGRLPLTPAVVTAPDRSDGTVGALATAGPEADRAARRFLGSYLEVLNGYRPAAQLRPLVTPTNAATVIEHLVDVTNRVPRLRDRRLVRAGNWTDPVQLRTMRACEPAPDVVEAAAALGVAERTWAMAFRLERRRGRWLSTAAQVW
nr:Rv3235 family protein [Micromonospora sp. DSM 115978]